MQDNLLDEKLGYPLGYFKNWSGGQILTFKTFWSYSCTFIYMKIIFLIHQTSSKLIMFTELILYDRLN